MDKISFIEGVKQERERLLALFERFIEHSDTFGKPDFKHLLTKMKKEDNYSSTNNKHVIFRLPKKETKEG